jgi:hypothetical protein
LPLCFSSFKTVKQKVYNVSNQKSFRHDVKYSGYNGITNENHLPLCFSYFELLKSNHEVTEEAGKSGCNSTALHGKIVVGKADRQPSHALNDHVTGCIRGYFSSYLQHVLSYQLENEDEVDQEILIKSHFPSPKLNKKLQQDFQQDKVFQSCLSSSENDVVFQFLSGLDEDEDSGTTYMETASSEQTNDIEFQESNKTVYATFQSMMKDNKEVVVLFDSFENHDFKDASMRTLECEIVHDVSFSHFQRDYEYELTSIHSFKGQSGNPQANFQKINKTKPGLFDEQKNSLDAYNMVFIFEDVQEWMNFFLICMEE